MAKRLIDAYLLKLNICSNKGSQIIGHSIVRKFRLDELIDEQPTVDAVEVVRCRDCKYIYFNKAYNSYLCRNTNGLTSHLKADYFCSYGERRKEK